MRWVIGMRALLLSALVLVLAPAAAAAAPRVLAVDVAPGAVVGQPVRIAVVAEGAEGVRLSLPDLQGGLAQTVCSAGVPARAPRRGRFELDYTPTWAGLHLLEVTVVADACSPAQQTASRTVAVNVAPAPDVQAGIAPGPVAASSCPYAGSRPRFSGARRLLAAITCLIAVERTARGLPPLRASAPLGAAAARQLRTMVRRRAFAHFGRRGRGVRAELATMATGGLATPRAVVAAWLGSDVHRRRLLDPRTRRIGAAVLRDVPVPPERPGATYVVELG